jgi:dihydrofolate synthase/folylpolyglutamate synthase
MELISVQQQNKKIRLLLDGAHNEAGVATLIESLCQGFPRHRLLLIWGNMADKNMGPVLFELMAMADAIILTRAESLRSAIPTSLYEQLSSLAQTKAHCTQTVEQALEMIGQMAEPEDLICVAGSLYLVGRVRQLLVGDLAQ